MSIVSDIAADQSREINLKMEMFLRLRVNPRPKWWPDFVYRWALRKLVVLEMTVPTFTTK